VAILRLEGIIVVPSSGDADVARGLAKEHGCERLREACQAVKAERGAGYKVFLSEVARWLSDHPVKEGEKAKVPLAPIHFDATRDNLSLATELISNATGALRVRLTQA